MNQKTAGFSYLRRCKSTSQVNCAFISSTDIIFRGSLIYFDYKAEGISPYIYDISATGEIQFSYFCGPTYQVDVTIKVKRGELL